MDDVRLGQLLRAARIRRGWRQADVAAAAGVSRQTVSRLERGELGGVTLDRLRAVAAIVRVQVDVRGRWRGGEGARLLSERHGVLGESVTRVLLAHGWEVRAEVSFSVYGERGVIDLLAWHAASQTLLVLELKTEIVDVGELLGTLDRKRRLAPRIGADAGWGAKAVGVALIVEERTSNRVRIRGHTALLRSVLPADGRTFARWLRQPTGYGRGHRLLAEFTWDERYAEAAAAQARPKAHQPPAADPPERVAGSAGAWSATVTSPWPA